MSTVHGIEHVGITVPDVAAATAFFEQVFDAEPLFDLLDGEPEPGDETGHDLDLEAALGVRRGAQPGVVRMLRLGDGPNIELFEFRGTPQREPVVSSDLGVQHIAVSVDDVDAIAARVLAAGGTLLSGPHDLPGPAAGPGNVFRYTRAPWGTTIELVSIPSSQVYERATRLRRWRPERRRRRV